MTHTTHTTAPAHLIIHHFCVALYLSTPLTHSQLASSSVEPPLLPSTAEGPHSPHSGYNSCSLSHPASVVTRQSPYTSHRSAASRRPSPAVRCHTQPALSRGNHPTHHTGRQPASQPPSISGCSLSHPANVVTRQPPYTSHRSAASQPAAVHLRLFALTPSQRCHAATTLHITPVGSQPASRRPSPAVRSHTQPTLSRGNHPTHHTGRQPASQPPSISGSSIRSQSLHLEQYQPSPADAYV